MSACDQVIEFGQSKQSPLKNWRQNLGHTKISLTLPRTSAWWTGLPPQACRGYSKSGKLHSIEIPNAITCSRAELIDYFNNTWTLTELLFSSLGSDVAFYRPPYHGLRHPLIFYYVHPAALYINKFRLAGLINKPINAYFESLFETGVDEMSWDDMSKNEIEWPSIDEALQYRRHVYEVVLSLIKSHPDLSEGHAPLLQGSPFWALLMSFEHERIHFETSSVLIRELPVHLVERPLEWPDEQKVEHESSLQPVEGKDYKKNEFQIVSQRTVSFGKPFNWPTYGWDNEYGHRSVSVSEFAANQMLVSNGEYWEFVSAGGYCRQEFWSKTGWSWRSFRDLKCPSFWKKDANSNRYWLRTCFELIPMQWDWPVIVNFHEAKAFSKWKSAQEKRSYHLATEAQQQALRQECGLANPSREKLMVSSTFNINLRFGSESPVHLACTTGGADSFCDLFGNVWQWSEDSFNPLKDSQAHPYYLDFSTPCYDGKHQMIFGGSFISTGDEATPWARFHFRPHFFQHAGFRLVQ